MNLDKISVGKNPPEEINVAIEIPAQSAPVSYTHLTLPTILLV